MKTTTIAKRKSASSKAEPTFGASILDDLPSPYAERLRDSATVMKLASGKPLFRKGDAGDGCYWLKSGLLKVNVTSPAGEKRTLAILAAGSIVGELAMLDGLPRSADVFAIADCQLTFVSRAAFLACLQENQELYRDVAAALAARLRQANEEAAAASFLSVKERVARTLLRLAEYLGEKTDGEEIVIRHRISQSDIAAMAGLARESVNRTLGEWRTKGIVDVPSRTTVIVHKARLKRELDAAPRVSS